MNMNPASKSRDKNASPNLRVVALFALMVMSAFSIYKYGVKAGRQEQYYLLPSQSAESQESAKEGGSSQPIASRNVLGIPEGEAKPLPSIRVEQDTEADKARFKHGTNYGGKGDKEHLGGFTLYDGMGVSPAVWKHMMKYVGVKSLMDVGCGKGVSTLYFAEHGADVLCLEGSHDGVTQTYLPDPENQIVEHDFSRGPYWPKKTYDAVWSVEFLEHVGRNYHFNYIQAFRKAALIFVTHSRWGGWHHVEVHKDDYWMTKFQMYGFQYSQVLTDQVKQLATQEHNTCRGKPDDPECQGPDGKYYNAQHVWLTMMVFINPAVAALPEHAHLMAEAGCYETRDKTDSAVIVHRECSREKKESELPEEFKPLEVTQEKHNAWLEKVKARVMPKGQPTT